MVKLLQVATEEVEEAEVHQEEQVSMVSFQTFSHFLHFARTDPLSRNRQAFQLDLDM